MLLDVVEDVLCEEVMGVDLCDGGFLSLEFGCESWFKEVLV